MGEINRCATATLFACTQSSAREWRALVALEPVVPSPTQKRRTNVSVSPKVLTAVSRLNMSSGTTPGQKRKRVTRKDNRKTKVCVKTSSAPQNKRVMV